MGLLDTARALTDSPAAHLNDHNQISEKLNAVIDVVADFGATGDGVTDDTTAIVNAINAADTLAGAGKSTGGSTVVVYFPPGVYLTDEISLSGKNVLLVGAGPASVVIKANSGVTGYLLDLEGWEGFMEFGEGSGSFGGFVLEGTGNGDATKAAGGLHMKANEGFHLADITIRETGGPCMFVEAACALGSYDRIVLEQPVSAGANDVPYLHIKGWHNGNVWNQLGFRRLSSDGDDGTSVAKIEFSTPEAHDSVFNYPWMQSCTIPDGGALWDVDAEGLIFNYPEFFDVASAVASPTTSTHFKFGSSTTDGGNMIRGIIPGRGTSSTSIAYGIIDGQGRNSFIGVRGYRDNNIQLSSGVKGTFVLLGGSISGTEGAGGAAFDDNSSQPGKNWMLDFSLPNANSDSADYSPSNVTTTRTIDADSTSVAELADVLGTLIADLQARGLI